MIKVIYHCYGGSHSSVTCAGIHLGLLPRDRIATARELLNVPHFDSFEEVIHGQFRFIGWDANNAAVYVLGKKTLGRKVSVLLDGIAGIFKLSDRVIPVDTTKPINLLMVSGGFLSRRLHLVKIGRPLVVMGTQKSYNKLVEIVDRTEERVRIKNNTDDFRSEIPRAIFYICPQRFRLGLLKVGFHLVPDAKDEIILNWARTQPFTGEIGSISLLGAADGYDLYLVGAGGEPQIITRTLKDYRNLMGIPRLNWLVVESPAVSLPCLSAKICQVTGLEKRVFNNYLDVCRQEVYDLKISLREGSLTKF